MPSAIQELLGKPADELSDEELMELIRGNRPQVAAPKASKKTSKRYADIEGLSLDDLDDIEELNLDDDDDEIENISLPNDENDNQ